MQLLSSFCFILLISKLETTSNGKLKSQIEANAVAPTLTEARGLICKKERNETQSEDERRLLMKLHDLMDDSERCEGKSIISSTMCFLFIT